MEKKLKYQKNLNKLNYIKTIIVKMKYLLDG